MLLIRFFSKLPFLILYSISDIIFFVSYHVIGYRKEVVIQNINNAFPELEKTEKKAIVKNFYKNLSDILVETVKALSISKEELKKRVKIKNPDVLEKHYHQKESIIVATSHQCNWEWLLLGCCIQIPYEVDAVYKHISNSLSRKIILGIRRRFGAYLIEKDNMKRELIMRKNKIRLIALVADQSPTVPTDRYWTTFLNQKTAFYKGVEKISKMMEMPVLYASMKRLKRGFYEIEFTELNSASKDFKEGYILEKYVKAAENKIKENPSDWLWSHKRWKHSLSNEHL